MTRIRALLPLATLLMALGGGGACTPPPSPVTLPEDEVPVPRPTGVEEVTPGRRPDIGPGEWALAVVGTPFFLVYKGIVCIGNLAIAGPVALVAVPAVDLPGGVVLRTLGEGIAQNCGPPYVLTPEPR